MVNPKKKNPNMENFGKEQPIPKESTEDNKIRVMLQISVPRDNPSLAFESVSGFNIPGLEVDTSYSPVAISPSADFTANLESEGKEVVVIRGTVSSIDKIEELRKQPGVLRVDDDPQIAPFSASLEPSDCDPDTPKGTLDDVVNYLKVNEIWDSGYRGTGVVIAVVDCGITANGRNVKPGETSNRINQVVGGWPITDWGTDI